MCDVRYIVDMSVVIKGIERRQTDPTEARDGVYWVLKDLLKEHHLPQPESERGGFDPDYIRFLMDVAELLERWTDAAEAYQDSEAAFIGRQIDMAIARAKEQFSGPFSKPPVRRIGRASRRRR
jgi:hypothetical protein